MGDGRRVTGEGELEKGRQEKGDGRREKGDRNIFYIYNRQYIFSQDFFIVFICMNILYNVLVSCFGVNLSIYYISLGKKPTFGDVRIDLWVQPTRTLKYVFCSNRCREHFLWPLVRLLYIKMTRRKSSIRI